MKLFEILKKLGILRSGIGDYNTGEYMSSSKKPKEKKEKDKSKSKRKGAPRYLLIITFLLAGFFMLLGMGLGAGKFFAMFVIWGFAIFFVIKMSFSIYIYFIILFVLIITSFSFVPTTETLESSEEGKISENVKEIFDYNSQEEIYIEAETGKLSKGGEYSRISESSRGKEAYLGDGGATVVYEFSLESAGSYTLFASLNDDGAHPSGRRNATVYINGNNIHYDHVSEDTGVWKWYDIGEVELKKGVNEISFRKDYTTSAAFIMDAFKLIPN